MSGGTPWGWRRESPLQMSVPFPYTSRLDQVCDWIACHNQSWITVGLIFISRNNCTCFSGRFDWTPGGHAVDRCLDDLMFEVMLILDWVLLRRFLQTPPPPNPPALFAWLCVWYSEGRERCILQNTHTHTVGWCFDSGRKRRYLCSYFFDRQMSWGEGVDGWGKMKHDSVEGWILVVW